ncbi:MAG: hypothetical protein H6719_20195 [Sandaracinaceae bacterium]|nr:hypothetical protein [Sandaracinaceae bacterium]
MPSADRRPRGGLRNDLQRAPVAPSHRFGAIADRRSLWDVESHARLPFSFPMLVQPSVETMHAHDDDAGLAAVAEAIPATRPLIDGLRAS